MVLYHKALSCFLFLALFFFSHVTTTSTTHQQIQDKNPLNIMILLPPMRGHRMPVLNLGKHLKDLGHSITAYTFAFEGETAGANGQSASEEARNAGFRVLEAKEKIPSLEESPVLKTDSKFPLAKLGEMRELYKKLNLLAFEDILDFYQNGTEPKPDVIVYEIFVMGGAAIAKQLDVAGVVVVPGFQARIRHDLLNTPWIAMKRYREVPPVYIRLANAILNMLIPQLWRYMYSSTVEALPDTHDWPLMFDKALNEGHLAISIPVPPVNPSHPQLPLIQNVGPILHESTSSSDEIPKKLKDWLDSAAEANESVIYVSFGSIWIPEKETLVNLTEGLISLVGSGGNRVLWARGAAAFKKYQLELPQEETGKFLIEGFVPQQAVLNYRNLIKAYISHCGSGSTYESLFYGIPILAVPLGADQYLISERLDDFKLGIFMNPTELFPDKLQINLKRLINEKEFADAVAQQRAILKLSGGGARAAQLVESIGVSGNLKLLRAFDSDWPWYASLSLDLLVFSYFLAVVGFLIIAGIIFVLVRCCSYCFKKKPKTKKD